MRNYPIIILAIVVLALLFSPVYAFTSNSFDIHVQPNGDARITFDYTLTWLEHAAVFMRIADPATELQKAITNNFNKQVTIASVTDHEMQLDVQDFASVQQANNATSFSTPGISFTAAENVLKQYWFAPLINPDLSPAITQITFPDGYVVQFNNEIAIPSVTHTVNR